MLVRPILLASLFGLCGCASAASSGGLGAGDFASAERALHERSDDFQRTESALDAVRAAAFWAEDAVVQPAGTPSVVGRPAVLALYRQFFGPMGVKELKGTATRLVIARSGDLAYETGINRIVIGTPAGDLLDVGKYLLVWRKIAGEWYVSTLSFTSDAPAPVLLKR